MSVDAEIIWKVWVGRRGWNCCDPKPKWVDLQGTRFLRIEEPYSNSKVLIPENKITAYEVTE